MVRLLGPLEVKVDSGVATRFRSLTALNLLAFLSLYSGREHFYDALYPLFWPDSDGDRQAQNLRRAIADLRKVLELDMPRGSVIITRKGTVAINPERVFTDVNSFMELANAKDFDTLREAFQLYKGPLLSTVPGSWMRSQRTQLEERYGQLTEHLCSLACSNGRVEEAIDIGRHALELAPTQESIHVALIQAYATAGKKVEALRQFEELEQMLDDIWGVMPSNAARVALDRAYKDSATTRHNLPENLSSFIGREKEVAAAIKLLSETRLLTLTGSGGCGKTRLTLEVARKSHGQYLDGTWFVELAPVVNPKLVPQTIALVLGIRNQSGVPSEQSLIDFLKPRRMLLVLDNCEHLLLACAQLVANLLRQCPYVQILASSREALTIEGETPFRVPSMPFPKGKLKQTPEELMAFASVQLFCVRARQARSAFRLTEDNAIDVASICARLDGIPLALELAAARLRSMSVREVNDRLDDRFRLLTGGARSALPRQQTLRALIDWSYDLLGEDERTLMKRLAVFAGGWTLEAAEAVTSFGPIHSQEVPILLASLVDKSLIVTDGYDEVTRYNMLDTVRQYALDRLQEGNDERTCHDRHFSYFHALAVNLEQRLLEPEQQKWLNVLEAEHDNIRAALLRSTMSEEHAEDALHMAGALSHFWEVRDHLSEGRAWLETVIAKSSKDDRSAARANALSCLGRLAWLQGDYDASRTISLQSLTLFRDLGDKVGMSVALNTLGNSTMDRGEPSTAQVFYEESLQIRYELDDKLGVAQSLGNLANVAFSQGNDATGLAMRERSLAIRRELGDRYGLAAVLLNWATDNFSLGHLEAARVAVEECVAICREIGHKRGLAAALRVFSGIARSSAEPVDARRTLEEIVSIYHDLGDRRNVAHSLLSLGEFELENIEYGAALSHCRESLATWADARDVALISETFRVIAHILTLQAQPFTAAKLWGAAASVGRESGITELKPNDLANLTERIAAARAAAGDDAAFDKAWREGQEMPLEGALALALAQGMPSQSRGC